MKFETESGSVYEVDEVEKRIRFVEGARPPHWTFAPAGEWKSFEDISYVCVGRHVTVTWADGRPTITNYVKAIRGQLAA